MKPDNRNLEGLPITLETGEVHLVVALRRVSQNICATDRSGSLDGFIQ